MTKTALQLLKEAVERVRDNSLGISLLLTTRCNFECGHCFYESGPRRSGVYMPTRVLNAVHDITQDIRAIDGNTSVNLVGGEPTLRMDQFKRVLDHVQSWDIPIEMTTNGWWLEKPKAARKFFEIVTPYVDRYGTAEELSVRISNDAWHDQFRPHYLRNSRLARALESLWEYDEDGVFYSTNYYCNDCEWEGDRWPYDGECPKCEGWVETEYSKGIQRVPPRPDPNHPWIWVQKHNGDHGSIVPIGRGEGFGNNDKGARFRGACFNGLAFDPWGRLTDICCSGSKLMIGNVNDHVLVLVALGMAFTKEAKPTCYGCHGEAEYWIKERGRKLKRKLYKQLERVLEKEQVK
jgi:uncharacterized Fe-S cluster-containing radical SAM superfamily protein